MKFCRYCGANVEGLVHHCDCCGAPLEISNDIFIWHIFVTSGAGDVPQFVKEQFDKINQIAANYQEVLPCITFNIYCYPSEMVQSHRIKDSIRVFSSQRKVSIRLVIDYESYVNSPVSEKKCLIRNAILKTLAQLRHRLDKAHLFLESFWQDIEAAV